MPLPPNMFRGRLPSYKGAYYLRHGPSGPVVVGWPKPRGKRLSPAQKAAMKRLSDMTALMKYLDAGSLENATEMAGNGIVLPRDLLLMMMYGRLWTVGVEGMGWLYSMATLQDISFLLDAIGQLPGTLIYRGPDFWDAVEPGLEGQVLQVSAEGLPEWVDLPETGSGYFTGITYAGTAYTHSTTNLATKGTVIRPQEPLEVTKIAVAGTGAGAAYNVGFTIAHLDAYSNAAAIDALLVDNQGSVTSTTGPAIIEHTLASPVQLDAGEPYLIAATRLGGLGTAQLNLYVPTTGAGQYQLNAPVEQIRSAIQYNTVGLSLTQTPTSTVNGQFLAWLSGYARA